MIDGSINCHNLLIFTYHHTLVRNLQKADELSIHRKLRQGKALESNF